MGNTGAARFIHHRKVSLHDCEVLNTSPKRCACMRKSHAHLCRVKDTCPTLPLTLVKLSCCSHTCMGEYRLVA
jgi:hypothetical protein